MKLSTFFWRRIHVLALLITGLQGMAQVVYWELVRGFPACFFCRGHRWLYGGILVLGCVYFFVRLFELYVLSLLLVVSETLWSLAHCLSKVGVWRCSLDPRFPSWKTPIPWIASSPNPLVKVLSGPLGWNLLAITVGTGLFFSGYVWGYRQKK